MEYKGCFDTVHGLIEDASKEFGAAFVVSPEKSEQVSRACEKVDALFEEIDCSVIDASVNMDNKVLTMGTYCFPGCLRRNLLRLGHCCPPESSQSQRRQAGQMYRLRMV